MASKVLTTFTTAIFLGLSALSTHADISKDLTVNDGYYHGARTRSLADRRNYRTMNFEGDLTCNAFDLENLDNFGHCVDLSQGMSRGSYDFSLSSSAEIDDDLFNEIAWPPDKHASRNNDAKQTSNYLNNNTDSALQVLNWEILTDAVTVTNTSNRQTSNLAKDFKNALETLSLDVGISSYFNINYMIEGASFEKRVQRLSISILLVGAAIANFQRLAFIVLFFSTGIARLLGFRRKKD